MEFEPKYTSVLLLLLSMNIMFNKGDYITKQNALIVLIAYV